MRNFSADEDAVIRAGYASGRSTPEIGKELGRTKNSIIGRAFRLGLESMNASRLFTEDEDDKVIQGYLAGEKLSDIARKLGRSTTMISVRRRALGIRPNRRVDVSDRFRRLRTSAVPA